MSVLREVHALYDALDDPSHLSTFLEDIQAQFGACNVGLAWVDASTNERAFVCTNQNLDVAEKYRLNLEHDPWMIQGQSLPLLPASVLGSDLVQPKDYRRSWFYDEVMKPGDVEFLLAVPKLGDRCSTVLAVNRSERQRDFGTEHIDRINPLAPHIARHGELLLAGSELRQIHQLQLPQFELGEGGVEATNAAALSLLSSQSALRVQSNRIVLQHPEANAKLQQMLRSVFTRDWLAVSNGSIRFPTANGAAALLMFPYLKVLPDFSRRYCASVVALFPDLERVERAIQHFGLTPAQASLARALAEGTTLSDFAASAGKSVHTARVQLRQVFLKTGCSSQADLIRLLHAFLGG